MPKKSDSKNWQFGILSYNYSMRPIYLVLFILIPALASASPAEEVEADSIPILETTQYLLGRQVNTVANRLDLFFADQRADDELARSRIRIRQRYELRERAKLDDQFQIRFNIRLPKLEQKFKFESDTKKAKEKSKEKAKSGTSSDIALNELDKSWQFRADIGVNASIPPKIFSRARLRKNMTSGDVIHRFVEEVAWYSDRDWEEYTTFDSDLALGENTLLRWRNTADWKVTRKDFKTGHGPSILHRLSDNDAISYGPSFTTIIKRSVWYVDNYRLGGNYRRNLYRHWIYADIFTGLDFPKIWSFRRTPYVGLQLEALFGGI